MKQFAGGVAVITGGASGFGKEFAKNAAGLGMKLVLADIQQDALDGNASCKVTGKTPVERGIS